MRGWQHRWVVCLTLTGALTVPFLIGSLSAQSSGQGAGDLKQPAGAADDILPRLLAGPDGEVIRFWQHTADPRIGGGGVLLALASPGNTWKNVLELLPREPGVSAVDADLAVRSPKEIGVVYQWRRHDPRTKQVRLAYSDDGGKTWTRSPTAIEGSGKGFTPKVAWGRGRSVVVVWADERRHDKTWDVYVRRSPDAGGTWEAEQMLSRFPKQTLADLAARPEMISDGQDRFWVVWLGLRNGRSRLYLNRSVDGGRTWTDPVSLTGQSQSVFAQRLVRSGERMLLVWQDARTGKDRIYSVSSSDGGVTWTAPTRVDRIPTNLQVFADSPAVVLGADGEAFVTWYDGRNGRDDVFVARSSDGGRTWGAEDVRLDMDEPGTAVSRFPKIAMAEDGRVAVAWEDDRAGHEGIYLRVRGNGPSPSWGPEVAVVPSGQKKKAARTPSVLWGSGGALYVAWNTWDFANGPSAISKEIDTRILFPDKK